MMLRRVIRVLCVVMLLILGTYFPAFANGGPCDGALLSGTGNVKLITQGTIALDEELILIQLDGDFADVHVHYRFSNPAGPAETSYAFPVDRYTYNKRAYEYLKEYQPTIRMYDENGAFELVSVEDSPEGSLIKKGYSPMKRQRIWYTTKLTIQTGMKSLNVDYRVLNSYEDWALSKSFYPEYSYRNFVYDLTPAGYWGDGVVKKFKVILDARNEIRSGSVIKKTTLPFKEYGGIYIFEAENVDFKTIRSIGVEYNRYTPLVQPVYNSKRAKPEHIKAVRTSSTLSGNYSIDNLFDSDLNTAWVEGAVGNGEGEWIEIELQNFNLGTIGIVNGYTKNKETYLANNRIKKMGVEVYFADGHDMKYGWELADKPYSELNKTLFAPFVDKIFNRGVVRPVTKIRLKILEVYPGTSYQDTCISELYLLGDSK